MATGIVSTFRYVVFCETEFPFATSSSNMSENIFSQPLLLFDPLNNNDIVCDTQRIVQPSVLVSSSSSSFASESVENDLSIDSDLAADISPSMSFASTTSLEISQPASESPSISVAPSSNLAPATESASVHATESASVPATESASAPTTDSVFATESTSTPATVSASASDTVCASAAPKPLGKGHHTKKPPTKLADYILKVISSFGLNQNDCK